MMMKMPTSPQRTPSKKVVRASKAVRTPVTDKVKAVFLAAQLAVRTQEVEDAKKQLAEGRELMRIKVGRVRLEATAALKALEESDDDALRLHAAKAVSDVAKDTLNLGERLAEVEMLKGELEEASKLIEARDLQVALKEAEANANAEALEVAERVAAEKQVVLDEASKTIMDLEAAAKDQVAVLEKELQALRAEVATYQRKEEVQRWRKEKARPRVQPSSQKEEKKPEPKAIETKESADELVEVD